MVLVCTLEPFLLPPLPLVSAKIEYIEGSVGLPFTVELSL